MVSLTTLVSPTIVPTITRAFTTVMVTPLSCAPDSTVTTTTDCTRGTTTSYCYSAPPPITCSQGYYPSVYHPGHCLTVSTCFPVPATTASCSNGETAYTTSILFNGTIDNHATVIEQPLCNCVGRYSYGTNNGDRVCVQTGLPVSTTPSPVPLTQGAF